MVTELKNGYHSVFAEYFGCHIFVLNDTALPGQGHQFPLGRSQSGLSLSITNYQYTMPGNALHLLKGMRGTNLIGHD